MRLTLEGTAEEFRALLPELESVFHRAETRVESYDAPGDLPEQVVEFVRRRTNSAQLVPTVLECLHRAQALDCYPKLGRSTIAPDGYTHYVRLHKRGTDRGAVAYVSAPDGCVDVRLPVRDASRFPRARARRNPSQPYQVRIYLSPETLDETLSMIECAIESLDSWKL